MYFNKITSNYKITGICECGGEKTKTPHSTWCPEYPGNKSSSESAIIKHIEQMHKLMSKLNKYGANDSEPKMKLKLIVDHATGLRDNWKFEPAQMGPDWWELYTKTLDCDDAAYELTNEAVELHKFIKSHAAGLDRDAKERLSEGARYSFKPIDINLLNKMKSLNP